MKSLKDYYIDYLVELETQKLDYEIREEPIPEELEEEMKLYKVLDDEYDEYF